MIRGVGKGQIPPKPFVIVAMAANLTVQQFAAIPHYHPTLAEIWGYPAEDLAEQIGVKQ